MNKETLRKKVNDIWADYYTKNPKQRKHMGNKIADLAFSTYFSRNSYGYIDNDRTHVVRTLAIVGIDKPTAEQYYDDVIKGSYAQSCK